MTKITTPVTTAETTKTTVTMLSDGKQIVRDDFQDVPGCIAGIQGTDRSFDFVGLREGVGGPRLLLDWGAFGKPCGRFWGRYGGPWLHVEALLEACGPQTGNPQLIVADRVAAKSMVLR